MRVDVIRNASLIFSPDGFPTLNVDFAILNTTDALALSASLMPGQTGHQQRLATMLREALESYLDTVELVEES